MLYQMRVREFGINSAAPIPSTVPNYQPINTKEEQFDFLLSAQGYEELIAAKLHRNLQRRHVESTLS